MLVYPKKEADAEEDEWLNRDLTQILSTMCRATVLNKVLALSKGKRQSLVKVGKSC